MAFDSILPPMNGIPPQIAAVSDYEAYARERMSASAWAYFVGGAADENTLRENVAAFARLRLRSRVLADLSGGSTALDLFGSRHEHPILLAPIGWQALAHPDGECATVLGAGAMRAGMVVSTLSSTRLEDIAAQAAAPLWFQLYLQRDRALNQSLVQRAEAAGYRALVVTVDAPVPAPRNREQRARFSLPIGVESANLPALPGDAEPVVADDRNPLFGTMQAESAPTWRDIEWLRSATCLPVVVKGITGAADARRALDAGAAGIIVSNHGGRVLDTQPASIELLPDVAAAVAGRVPLLLDGGIRRGTDVLKALALGADAVLLGRPYVHALAVAGSVGVAHVLHLLRVELESAMALTGCRRLSDIGPGLIHAPDLQRLLNGGGMPTA